MAENGLRDQAINLGLPEGQQPPVEETPQTPSPEAPAVDESVDIDALTKMGVVGLELQKPKTPNEPTPYQLNQLERMNWNQRVDVQGTDTPMDVYRKAYMMGDAAEDQAQYELIESADFFFPVKNGQGQVVGTVENGLQVINNNSPIVPMKKDQFDFHRMAKSGSVVIAHKVPLNSDLPNKQVRTINGETVAFVPTFLEKYYDTQRMTGQVPIKGRDGQTVLMSPEPSTLVGRAFDYLYASDENRNFDVAQMLDGFGIDPIQQNRIIKASDKGFMSAFQRGETLKDMGKFVYNNLLALSTGDFEYVFGEGPEEEKKASPLGMTGKAITAQTQAIRQGRIDMQNEEVLAYGSVVARQILNGVIAQEQEKLDEKNRVSGKYYPYARQTVAEGMGITEEQADQFIRFNADLLEYGTDLFAEGVAITGPLSGINLLRTAAKVPAFNSYLTRKMGTQTVEEAREKAVGMGLSMKTLRQEFMEETHDFSGLNQFRMIRDARVTGGARRLGILDEVRGVQTPQTQQYLARVEKATLAHQTNVEKLRDLRQKKAGVKAIASQRLKTLNSGRKNLMATYSDRQLPSSLMSATGEEFSFAYGAAIAGDVVSHVSGEENRAWGEMGGALTSLSLFVPLTKKAAGVVSERLIFGTAGSGLSLKIPGARTAYVGWMKALGEVDPDTSVQEYFKNLPDSAMAAKLKGLLWDNASPATRDYLVNRAQNFAKMQEDLLKIKLPDGSPAFKEDEIFTMLADITMIGSLKAFSDHTRLVISSQGIAKGVLTGDELIAGATQQIEIARRIQQTLNRFEAAAPHAVKEGTKDIIESTQNVLKEELNRVNRDFDDAMNAVDSLQKEYDSAIAGGNPLRDDLGEVIDAEEGINTSSYKRRIEQYTGDDAAIANLDEWEKQVLQDRADFLAARRAELEANANMGEMDSHSVRFVQDAQEKFHQDQIDVDTAFRKVDNVSKTARADAGVVLRILRDNDLLEGLEGNLSDIQFSNRVNGELEATTLVAGEVKGRKVRRVLIDQLAEDVFKENPMFRNAIETTAGKPISEMTEGEIKRTLGEVVEDIYDDVDIPPGIKELFGEGDRPPSTMAEYFDFFDELVRDKDLATQAGLSHSPEGLQAGVSISALSSIVKYLGKSVDPSTPGGLALAKTRRYIKNGIMKGFEVDADGRPIMRDGAPVINPNAGFKENFYSDTPEDIGVEFRSALDEADTLYETHLARYHNKNVNTHDILNMTTTEGNKVADTFMPDLIRKAVAEASKTGVDAGSVMTNRLTVGLARLNPQASVAKKDAMGNITFEIDASTPEGKAAVDELKGVVRQYAHATISNSNFGQEFRQRSLKKQVYGINMEKGKIVDVSEAGRGQVVLEDKDIIMHTRKLSLVRVKTGVDQNGEDIFEPLITMDEIWAPYSFRNVDPDAPSPRDPDYKKVNPRQVMGPNNISANARYLTKELKSQMKAVRGSVEYTREEQARLFNSMKKYQQSMGQSGVPATFREMFQSPDGFEYLQRTKEDYVTRRSNQVSRAEALEEFDQSMRDIIFEDALNQTRGPDGVNVTKFLELAQDETYLRSLEALSPSAANGIRSMGKYLGTYTKEVAGSARLSGIVGPINTASEMSRLFAVWSGRVSYKFLGMTFLTTHTLRSRQAAFKAFLEDPKAGETFVKLLSGSRPPTREEEAYLYKVLLQYTARDYVLYSDSDYYDSVTEIIGGRALEGAKMIKDLGADFLLGERYQEATPAPAYQPNIQTLKQRQEQLKLDRQTGE